MTMVPRAGPLSAISAPAITSWYQRGKSSARVTIAPFGIRAGYLARVGWPKGESADEMDQRWAERRGELSLRRHGGVLRRERVDEVADRQLEVEAPPVPEDHHRGEA